MVRHRPILFAVLVLLACATARSEPAPRSAVWIDARPVLREYIAGHIPRALHRPWTEDVVPDGAPGAGSWKPVEALREAYAALEFGPDTEVIVYCNTGHMASFGWWTLRERLGYEKVRLYDGSWVEWSMGD